MTFYKLASKTVFIYLFLMAFKNNDYLSNWGRHQVLVMLYKIYRLNEGIKGDNQPFSFLVTWPDVLLLLQWKSEQAFVNNNNKAAAAVNRLHTAFLAANKLHTDSFYSFNWGHLLILIYILSGHFQVTEQ